MNKNSFAKHLLLFLAALSFGNIAYAEKAGDNNDIEKLTTNKHPVDDLGVSILTDRGWETLMEEEYPETPEMIEMIKNYERARQKALYTNPEPNTLNEILTVDTSPGAEAPVVYVSPRYTTILNVVDSTGEPWPLRSAMTGNSVDYRVSRVESHTSANIVKVDALREFGSTNMVLSLVDMPTTLNIKISNSLDNYHPTPILQIDMPGPQAKELPVFSTPPILHDEILKRLVLGLAPSDFKKHETNNSLVEAWSKDDVLFLRTSLNPVSPRPRTVYRGPNNYSAYKLEMIPLIVFFDANGQKHRVIIN